MKCSFAHDSHPGIGEIEPYKDEKLVNEIRDLLRRVPLWVGFQTLNREGWRNAAKRLYVQRRILTTPSIETSMEGPVEVRVLTWRRDWLNVLWALKSFYHFACVTYPLYIHDGGLKLPDIETLRDHFPNAVIVSAAEADEKVIRRFKAAGWTRCLAYRQKNVATRKLFDFFSLSQAQQVISIDSDILFFDRPTELIESGSSGANVYNKDLGYGYSMTVAELAGAFGIEVPPYINSGLSRVEVKSIEFGRINQWLANEKLFSDEWVTEQTLHALCSSLTGVRLLPESYAVATVPGFPGRVVAKHYPGYFRPLLYQEGMVRLLESGFLDKTYEASVATRARPAVLRVHRHLGRQALERE